MKIKIITFLAILGFSQLAQAQIEQISAYKTKGLSWPIKVILLQDGKLQSQEFKRESKPMTFNRSGGDIAIFAGGESALDTYAFLKKNIPNYEHPGVKLVKIDPKTIVLGSRIKLITDDNAQIEKIIITGPKPSLLSAIKAKIMPEK